MRFRKVVLFLIGLWTSILCCIVVESSFLGLLDVAIDSNGYMPVSLRHPTRQDIPLYELEYDTNEFIPSGTVIPSGKKCRGYDSGEEFISVICYFGAVREPQFCGMGGKTCGYVYHSWVQFAPPYTPLKSFYTFLFRVSIIITFLLAIIYLVWNKRSNAVANSSQNEAPPT
jgi:hypothetical protein